MFDGCSGLGVRAWEPATATSSTSAPSLRAGRRKGGARSQLPRATRKSASRSPGRGPGLRSQVAGEPSEERQAWDCRRLVLRGTFGRQLGQVGPFSRGLDSPNLKESSSVRMSLHFTYKSLFIHLKFATLGRDYKSIPTVTCSSNPKNLECKIKIILMVYSDG